METLTTKKMVTPPPNNGKPVVHHIDTFVSQLYKYSSRLYLNPDEAYRQSKDQARAMRRDPVIMQPLRQRQLATALLDWQIQPEDSDDPVQKKVCEDLTAIVKRVPYFLKLRMCLLEAVWFGRYAVQLGYEWAGEDFNDLSVCSWVPFHGDKLAFEQDTGKVGIFVGQLGTKADDLRYGPEARVRMFSDYERESIIVHKHEVEDGDFFEAEVAGGIHGVGLRTRVYWPWWIKQTSFQWLMTFLERAGLGVTVWYYESGNDEDYKATKAAAENLASDTIILAPMPIGAERSFKRYERVEPGMSGADMFKGLMDDYLGGQIRGMIVGQEATSQKMSTGLGSEIANVQKDTFRQINMYDAINLGETITNDFLKVLAKYNYPGIDWTPKFECVLKETDPKGTLEAAKMFQDMGGEVGEDQLREVIGLPKPGPEEKILSQVPQLSGGMLGEDHPTPHESPTDEQQEQPDMSEPEAANTWVPVQFIREGEPIRFAKGMHSPKGGITIQGTFFPGGQFIPSSVLAKASPEEKAKLQATRQGYEAVKRNDDKTYHHADDAKLDDEFHERVKALRLPPAWTGVQVSSDPKSPLQAIGYDEKGRVQYRYSAEHSAAQAAKKFARVEKFVEKLPQIRQRINEALDGAEGPDKEAAAVLYLIDKTGFRVGSDRDTMAEKKAHGATTLDSSHLVVDGDEVTFSFVGKKGVDIKQTIQDARLASMLLPRAKRGGKLFDTTDGKVRDFLHKIAGNFKVKDFRTAVAADQAMQAIDSLEAPKSEKEYKQKRLEVGRIVAEKLGNTPTVALASYIPPEVFAPWQAKMISSPSKVSKNSSRPSATTSNQKTSSQPTTMKKTTTKTNSPSKPTIGSLQQPLKLQREPSFSEQFAREMGWLDDRIQAAADAVEQNPTDAQKDAGNYRKGHVTIQGLPVTIENIKGSTRSGKSKDGTEWSVEMKSHYGYIKRTESEADGDHIDVFVGPDPESEIVFVVDQNKGDSDEFDEHKCMIGWSSKKAAKAAYLANYSSGWPGFASITSMTMDEFKDWIENGDTSKPMAELQAA